MTYTIPEKIIETIRKSRRMVISTGAGISAESGIATFRDPVDGLWSQYDPELLSTPEAFRRDPSLVWGWYETMRGQMRNASPNPAHHAVTELTVIVPEVALITQNIDDLHERAGASDVIHLHGRVFDSRCFACARPHYRRDIPATLGGADRAASLRPLQRKDSSRSGVVRGTTAPARRQARFRCCEALRLPHFNRHIW